MTALLIMLKYVLIFIALAIPGFILVKCKLLKTENSAILSKLLLYVGMPFLILSSVFKIEITFDTVKTMSIIALIGIVLLFAFVFLSKPLFSFRGIREDNSVERFCAVFPNNGFLGIPLATAVFSNEPLIVTFVVVLNIITNIIMYSVGENLFKNKDKKSNLLLVIFNPVVVSFIVGIIINVSGLLNVASEIKDYTNYLSAVVTPVSMIIIGMKLGEIKFGKIFKCKLMYYTAFIKLILFPVLGVSVLFAIRLILPVSKEIIMAVFIALAMPTAGLATVFAEKNNGNVEKSVILTLGTTLLSMLTIPSLFWLLTICL